MTAAPIAAVPDEPARRLRLLAVTVQPRLVIDDGETLIEVEAPPMRVNGADWPEFAASSFGADDLARMLSNIDQAGRQ